MFILIFKINNNKMLENISKFNLKATLNNKQGQWHYNMLSQIQWGDWLLANLSDTFWVFIFPTNFMKNKYINYITE